MTSFRTLMLAGLLVAGSLTTTACVADDDYNEYLQNVTVMNMNAEARRVVTQDRLRATLMIQREAKTAAAAQALVNEKMQAALAMANKVKGVKANTGGYNVYKNYPPMPRDVSQAEREKNAIWRAQQTLELDGADKDAVLKLSGALQQQDFAMNGMNFYLSREATDALKDELTVEALSEVQARAKAIAKQLGMPKVRLATVNIGSSTPPPMPYMARNMVMKADMAESMPEPVGQAGESEVTLNVNVEVHLSK